MAEVLQAGEGSPIRAGFFNRDAFRKKSRMLLVLQSSVAGLDYMVDTETPEGQALLESLTPGTELLLLREADNEYDQWAVAVCTMDKRPLGHVTRYKNETIARLMDLGKAFRAYVEEEQETPEEADRLRRTRAPTEGMEVFFSVYMED